MISIIKDIHEDSSLVKLFQELHDSLPKGTATLERTDNNDGTIIRLVPSNPSAAQFGAHTEYAGFIDVFFGSGTTFELENRDDNKLLDLVRRLGLAVISGKCEERFGLLGVRGQIHLDGERGYRCTHYFYPHLFPKTVHYEAYSHGTTKSSL